MGGPEEPLGLPVEHQAQDARRQEDEEPRDRRAEVTAAVPVHFLKKRVRSGTR